MRRLPPRSCVLGRFDHVPYRKRHPLHLNLPSKTLTKLETKNMTKKWNTLKKPKNIEQTLKKKTKTTTTKISPVTPTPTASLHFQLVEHTCISSSENSRLVSFLRVSSRTSWRYASSEGIQWVAFQLDSWWFSSWLLGIKDEQRCFCLEVELEKGWSWYRFRMSMLFSWPFCGLLLGFLHFAEKLYFLGCKFWFQCFCCLTGLTGALSYGGYASRVVVQQLPTFYQSVTIVFVANTGDSNTGRKNSFLSQLG